MRNTSDKKRSSSQSVDNSSLLPQKKLKVDLPPPSTPRGTATSSSKKSDFKGVKA